MEGEIASGYFDGDGSPTSKTRRMGPGRFDARVSLQLGYCPYQTVPTVRHDSVSGGKGRGQSVFGKGFTCARGLTSFLRIWQVLDFSAISDHYSGCSFKQSGRTDWNCAGKSSAASGLFRESCPAFCRTPTGLWPPPVIARRQTPHRALQILLMWTAIPRPSKFRRSGG